MSLRLLFKRTLILVLDGYRKPCISLDFVTNLAVTEHEFHDQATKFNYLWQSSRCTLSVTEL